MIYKWLERNRAVDFVASLKLEIDSLENSLKATPDPRLVKLQELRRVLALYTGATNPAVPPQATDSRREIRAPSQKSGRKILPERLEAIKATTEILRQMPGPIKTAELFDMITKMGIKIGGNDPLNNFSALLYGRDEFKSHGREGWALKKNKGPPALASEPS
jgi:hypothetical protein